MNLTPVISVVIPTYNRACTLKRALKSVQNQTFFNWEILIIDNYSIDNTDKVVRELNDNRIKLFKIHNNGVIAASRNLGVHKASGEFIAFLDSDDWWKPEKLQLSLDALNAGADIVYHDLFLVTKSNQLFFWRKVTTHNLTAPVFINLLKNGNCINNSSVVIRKSLLASVGGLSEDTNLIAIEDYDCWLRIAKLTNKFTRINKTLGYYWAGGGNISNQERVINNIDTILLLYLENDYIWHHKNINWVQYSRGRAYFLLQNFEIAKKYLSNIGCTGTPFRIYIRSQWMLLLIKISSYRYFKKFIL